ncbi:zinc-binding dehydrogenase [Micromonospora sp. BRA006-A]|uniref:zinc-binding dehydrogenase n=1 Tax=Micromonospora sp. BRA006-A TaxID=2962860 RepID=UPI00296E3ED7|nr:zinc-binding dehydrogenase [Micromonospora sp. BRA006-A]MDW3850918.1 zinc-binding dehydrogenase [Micromonospora sp. BRA006-A]
MRAVWLREFGGPEVLVPGTAPDPAPGPGQVLVDVAHANITFVETMFRASGFGPFGTALPVIPGNGVGGTITALGPGVDPALAGRVVVTATGGTGGYAERVVVDRDAPVPVPPGLPLDAAVALMADGRTALMLARAAGLRPGDRVLVEAAAGGVGSLLTQLAAAAGATVVAAAGGGRKVGVLRAAGLDVAVDYRQAGWADRVRDAVGAVDVMFDGVGGPLAREAFDLLDRGGRMLSFGLAGGTWADIPAESAAARGVTLLSPRPGPDELRALTEAALAEGAAGRLRPLIGQRFPLERAAAAHAAIEARETLGKTLLDVR